MKLMDGFDDILVTEEKFSHLKDESGKKIRMKPEETKV